ncbi:FG-GAP-like repeat-containing protein [Streptomyces sp. IBSBF 3136]|uniref:FG-GAP-like repeat-containing protein n=1 Tax=Streptomyces sp. IBSBF 3136 TaxID=2903524 RepID=UPI003FA705D6
MAVWADCAVADPAKLADDFNGDGYRDLAIGMPQKAISGKEGAGAVLLTFGSAHGLTGKHVYITQNSTGIPGTAGYQDFFGSSLASGDLNHDGYADLLVGREDDTTAGTSDNGSVTVLWGGASPLRRGLALPMGQSYSGRMLGSDIAVGDFTGDSAPDVAVSGQTSLRLYSGTFTRTKAPAGIDVSDQDPTGIWNITAGDFDGGGKADLAVSAPEEDPYRNQGSGALWQLRGTSNGVSTRGVSVFGSKDYGVAPSSGIGETLLD